MTKPRRPLTLADLTTREREHLEVCIHEAGHAVAAVALGGALRSAVVAHSRVTGLQGLTTVADMPHGRDPEIAYAGPWSQARWRAGRSPSQRQVFAVLGGSGYRDERALIAAGGTYLGTSVVPLAEQSSTRCRPDLQLSATLTSTSVTTPPRLALPAYATA